jgi:predicted ferric reductase
MVYLSTIITATMYLIISFIAMIAITYIRVITKLPNSEQSYKGKVKTHMYINRQISQQPENVGNCDHCDKRYY